MSQGYTPGLEVSPKKQVRKLRELPLPGIALVKIGQKVSAQTPVLSAELPGDLDILRIADRLGLEPEQVVEGMRVKVGDSVVAGQLLCEVKSFFGWLASKIEAPAAGTVEFFTPGNAHLGIRQPPIPLEVAAYLDGEIVEIEAGKSVTVESDAAIIQGIFGVGGERFGEVFLLDVAPEAVVTPEIVRKAGDLSGKIVVGGKSMPSDTLKALAQSKISAAITASIDSETLGEYLGFELGVSITGDEDVPFTLIVTEGFGQLPLSKRVYDLAKLLHGKQGSVNGATQVRAGAMRPELVVSGGVDGAVISNAEGGMLEVGTKVRVIRVPYFGEFGTITALPHALAEIESGALLRVAGVKLDSGSESFIPRANLEIV